MIQDCGDFIEAIDTIAFIRAEQKFIREMCIDAKDSVAHDKMNEQVELLKRDMKDFLRANSAAKGFYVKAKPTKEKYAPKR